MRDNLRKVLEDLEGTSPDIEGSALVSREGFMLASALHTHTKGDRVAALSAALLHLGTRSVQELKRGTFQEVYVRGEDGSILLTSAGDAVLATLTRKEARLGSVLQDVRRAAERIAQLLRAVR